MAEIGLVRFARVAYEVSCSVLAAQRTRYRYSKRVFSQPQLMAVLCLMRFEDWTFREAEVRLSEHSENLIDKRSQQMLAAPTQSASVERSRSMPSRVKISDWR